MIEIRRLIEDELNQIHRMHSIVYNFRKDFSKEENQKSDPLAHPADWAWGVFEGKKLLAGMYDIDFLMRFDGNSVKMSGIGGVGTLPEERKSGHVRRIFEKLLPEAYEKGIVFSNLTPFSHDFYRKFGYEIACARNKISIPANNFAQIKPYGQFIHILPGDDTAQLAEVHSAYIANINHGIHRDYWAENRAWKRFTKDESCATGNYIYLWKDENGTPRSYIKYQDVLEDGEHNMSVSELAFIDKKGLYGVLGIVGGLSAQFKKFKWLAPTFIDAYDFAGDAWSVTQEYIPRDMTRIVNVKTALESMRCPCLFGEYTEGEYVIEVKDENISANTGKYLVQFGREASRVSLSHKNADVMCSVQTLS
jgi:predicted acetyltransferase